MHQKLLAAVHRQSAYAAVLLGLVLTIAWLGVLGWVMVRLINLLL